MQSFRSMVSPVNVTRSTLSVLDLTKTIVDQQMQCSKSVINFYQNIMKFYTSSYSKEKYE